MQTSTTSFLLVRERFHHRQPARNRLNKSCVCFSLQYKVFAVPAEEFSIDYVEPKLLCVSTHGRFTEDRWLIQHLHEQSGSCKHTTCDQSYTQMKID